MTDLATTFGTRIKTARQAAEITQHDLAARIGKSQQWVSALESGQLIPRDADRFALAKALGVPVGELFAYPAEVA